MANEFVSIVWQWIRNRQCCKQKFRREYPIPPYTVDFCCVEIGLVIEIDGEHHLTPEGIEHDRIRDRFLNSQGFQVLRIQGYDIIRDGPASRARIYAFVKAAIAFALERERASPPRPHPSERAQTIVSPPRPLAGEGAGG